MSEAGQEWVLALPGGLQAGTVRSSCRSRPANGHRGMTWTSTLDTAPSPTGNSTRKEKTARRLVLTLYSENSTTTERLLETHTANTLNRADD